MRLDTEDVAAFLGGFVAAEGCFSGNTNGTRFVFEVGLGRRDRGMCQLMQQSLGIGRIYDSPRRRAHHDDQSALMVQPLRELVEVVVPFMDAHLPISHKRAQCLEWKARLLDYWEHKAKRVRLCTVEGARSPAGRTACVAIISTSSTACDP